MKLRTWQRRAIETTRQVWKHKPDCMVVATPGAGKTTFALTVARQSIDDRSVGKVCIVCPSRALKEQWERKAAEMGLPIRGKFGNEFLAEGLPEDCIGWVATYQQVAANWEIHRALTDARDTLVILDEVHHGGDDLAWGKALRESFDSAKYRLLLSGTPFRSDNAQIPFVTYENGKSVADYSYTYAEAILDSVCRDVVFPSFEGEMQWLTDGAKVMNATFSEKLNDTESRRRLNTAIDASGDFVREILSAAHEKLIAIRNESQAEAGGLVFARDQMHAQMLAGVLAEVSGRQPALIVSDDPQSAAIRRTFGDSSDMWAVAVKMVSEGVDIPRLRVGVYLTNVAEELFLRQAIGRFVRMQGGFDNETAHVFFPRHEAFLDVIREIKEERDHVLQQIMDGVGVGGGSEVNSPFIPLSSKGIESEHFSNSTAYGIDEIRAAREFKQSIPELKGASEIGIVKLLRAQGAMERPAEPIRAEQTYDESNASASRKAQAVVNRLGWMLFPDEMKKNAGKVCASINNKANGKLGIGSRKQQTTAQIQAKFDLLTTWMNEATNGRHVSGF